MAERLAPSEKHTFMHNGRTVYEWDQTLTEVSMYASLLLHNTAAAASHRTSCSPASINQIACKHGLLCKTSPTL
jgi:hypothetical protein